MRKLLCLLTIFFVFGLTTATFVQSAPRANEGSPVVQGTLMEIDGPFFVIMDGTGKEQRIHVDKSTLISGKIQPGVRVKAEVTQDGHASSVKKIGS